MIVRFAVWVAAACVFSCASNAGTGGSAGSGGIAGAGPVPPPAEGGAYLRIYPGNANPAGTACLRTTGHELKIPWDASPTAAGIGPFTQDTTGTPVTDGLNAAAVTCIARGSGPFQVEGRLQNQGISFSIVSLPAQVDGTASITSSDPRGLDMQSPVDAPCVITALQVQPNAARVTFRCARYHDPSDPMATGCAAEGVVVLQNCEPP